MDRTISPAFVRLSALIVAAAGGVLLLGAAKPAPVSVPSGPGREPVLKQIKVPHRYYYREMYLPQVTSGPCSASWSPDGRELVFAMQGSLWRVAPATGIATQITDGPGYDHQPDWSPDGRFIAYACYRDDAVELWLFEVRTGKSWPLTANGAVNVEPRCRWERMRGSIAPPCRHCTATAATRSATFGCFPDRDRAESLLALTFRLLARGGG